MNTDPVRIERRPTQRFAFQLLVSVRLKGSDHEGYGFTQDLSARGALFYTDYPLSEGAAVELTLLMPAEITLAEAMRVRCRAKVVRVVPPAGGTACGIAVHLEGYEYLPEPGTLAKGSAAFGRISALHERDQEEGTGSTLHTFHPRSAVLS
jgi:hypothetical protein